MFTDLACRPPIHNFPYSPHSQENLSKPSFGDNLQNKGPRQRLRRPEQYAHPLRGPLLSPSTQISHYDASEHMLRRKTPNGTLAAGYDGRPVELTSRPHAIKHYLMPVSKAAGKTLCQPLSSEHHNTSFSRSPHGSNVRGHSHNDINVEDEASRAAHEWRFDSFSNTGLDSVLHQGSISHYDFYAGGPQVPTVLQPMWPPYLGLTSLNDSGLYGPYWPDGAYVPYRPAPVRDPRFQGQGCQSEEIISHMDGAVQSQLARNNRGNWSHGGSDLDCISSTECLHGTLIMASDDISLHISKRQQKNDTDQSRNPLAYRGRLTSLRHQYLPLDSRWGDNSRCHNPPSFTNPQAALQPSNLNAQANNAQFREKVLIWAHRIYVDLLAFIHRSKRSASNGQRHAERHVLRGIEIYPKPPKQPTFNPGIIRVFENTSAHNANSPGINRSALSGNDLDNPQGFLRSPFEWPHSNQWQPNKYLGDQKPVTSTFTHDQWERSPSTVAMTALEQLRRLCQESGWEWTDGLLLGGCLAYGLGDYHKATKWYSAVLQCDPNNVEAISNLAATSLSLNKREEAEHYWLRSVKLRPSYFEAVEHLVGLFCEDHRGKEAVKIIEDVQRALLSQPPQGSYLNHNTETLSHLVHNSETASEQSLSPCHSIIDKSPRVINSPPGYQIEPSGYAIPPSDNGRILALVHGKGNMLYALGDNIGAARAFEDAILIGAGKRHLGIRGLIQQITRVFSDKKTVDERDDPILLLPEMALQTSLLVFSSQGHLPGLVEVADGMAKRAAVSIISNSLLSLAKIYQDGMSFSGATATGPRATSGVQDILALYYLSLSLQPSPSTANNVGILLASVQQSSQYSMSKCSVQTPVIPIPGVVPGSGIALALAYYNYGLNLDPRHAHLYTNLGSLFKDIGQLSAAIKMYEKAVNCDGNFDIALANLANAVKDQGRISDAIAYYKRAVRSNPDFAEAVCGLANALNSVCSWTGRGGIVQTSVTGHKARARDRWHVNEQGMMYDGMMPHSLSSGWIERVVAIVEKQLRDGEAWGKGIINSIDVEHLQRQFQDLDDERYISNALQKWTGQPWEGAKVVRLVERATKRLGWQSYRNKYLHKRAVSSADALLRPQLPAALAIPSAPTVLPFHTFTCPLSAKQIRKISQRNGLRVSCSTLRASWLPTQIYPPPAPPQPHLNVGYVSSDFNNHPLAHLMQSVFGFHNAGQVRAFCYATTASDGSIHRQQIEREAPIFLDASSWSIDCLVNRIVDDGIHILVNLNGYTRGAKNEVFAARPAPIQMSFMGFAGTLGAEWCDYLLADKIAIPPQTLRPWRRNVDLLDQTKDGNNDDDHDDWVYGENVIFTRDTFFCCDHRQSAPDAREVQLSWPDEQQRRWRMRKELFPDLADDTIILGNFNQLYKIEPTTFRTWLRILSRIPKAVLWLLRFPELGEHNLKQTAMLWVGSEVADRIRFTDVAPKHQHISRARICDLFLDTPECNAHTTAADVLWSGTPLLTLPRYEYKMCSRMAASILRGALPKTFHGDRAANELIANSDEEYEERAVELGSNLVYTLQRGQQGIGKGRLVELRKLLYESRWTSALFDTRRWVRDLESAYATAWSRWVAGQGGDIWL